MLVARVVISARGRESDTGLEASVITTGDYRKRDPRKMGILAGGARLCHRPAAALRLVLRTQSRSTRRATHGTVRETKKADSLESAFARENPLRLLWLLRLGGDFFALVVSETTFAFQYFVRLLAHSCFDFDSLIRLLERKV